MQSNDNASGISDRCEIKSTAMIASWGTESRQREDDLMIMRPIKSSAQAWNRIAARLALVTVIAMQSLGAAWVQEPEQPRIDEEFSKQEKIYHRHGQASYVAN
jgi:hypothetical protein